MTKELFARWQQDWRWMEDIAQRRGWDVTPLSISPPASVATIKRIETAYGQAIPEQLRRMLTDFSGHIAFGWHIPSHLQALEKQSLPTMSFNRDAIWDIEHIEYDAIPNFLNWKASSADIDASEAPNTPDMWKKQFPFYTLVNGDMLTIDMRSPTGPHPVRYFSHELAVLHGMALAPDFFSFITEMSKLGFAGTEWASWMPFGEWKDDTYYLTAESAGGRAWRAWLEREPAAVETNEPPPAIVGTTTADRALLEAALSNNTAGVLAALAAGATPDAIWNSAWDRDSSPWEDEFSNAVSYAVRHGNIVVLEALVKAGASLNTRHLAMAEAAITGTPATARWLVTHGARVNGWKDERYWPIHHLLTQRNRYIAADRSSLKKRLQDEQRSPESPGLDAETVALMRQAMDDMLQPQLERQINEADFLATLQILLEAGADPDAKWDNGTTMLYWAEPDASLELLKHGADVNARASGGEMPLHYARTPEKIRVLVEHNADINAVAEPTEESSTSLVYTPLQASLLGAWNGVYTNAKALLALGADPKVRDLKGRSTLCYCTRVEGFKLMETYGLDPLERLPDGGTLLHNLLTMTSLRAANADEVAMLDHLLALGIDINATDGTGRTMLHVAVGRTDVAADIKLLLDRGADKSIRDKDGKRASDLTRRSQKDIRTLLK
ncbi:hypothetical protein KX729_28350 [Rhizobium sp. XQZ8]|uniref:hypothetical protein n=1 Tax=Rhizobium populisoli TaxID=2859785 RepID=UPI001CA52145|nr:hypothetical protein [Rhizobium populisoli]MBW6425347.1 hypothetical protein [Rhizobium populisoli]